MKIPGIFQYWKKMTAEAAVQKEHGRSMVEMLGVLAIIGVLSIGAIAGYTMAMNRYKANQILDLASKLSVMAQTGYAADAENWNGITEEMYNELDMVDYGGSGGAYETTFDVDKKGNVNVWSENNSIQNALRSVTGIDAPTSASLRVITVK